MRNRVYRNPVYRKTIAAFMLLGTLPVLAAPNAAEASVRDPATAMHASIDRFSDEAGHLFKRSASPSLPGPGQPINMDAAPFITEGFSAIGDFVSYYNFDAQSKKPAPIYVFFKVGDLAPLAGQLNIVDVIPGDTNYNDFWNVVKVAVPQGYVPNQITSVAQLMSSGYPLSATSQLVNCPIVPHGSIAKSRYDGSKDTGLHLGWYRDQVIEYFHFGEKALAVTPQGKVPSSPIYVTFNKNPNPMDITSGPPSGFVTDQLTGRTHNVVLTVPENAGYSPLWKVEIYDNQSFSMVHDSVSAIDAPLLVDGAAFVNCPVVSKSTPTLQAP